MPTRKYQRVSVNDDLKWGRLVKQWVKGTQETPKTIDELVQQCQKREFSIKIPDYLNSVMFIQPPMGVMCVRLPPKELVEDSETVLAAPGGTYELPLFYKKRFGTDPNLPTAQERLEFHDERIGDYTITLCV